MVDSDTVALRDTEAPPKALPFDYRWLVAGGAGVLAVGLLVGGIQLVSRGDRGPADRYLAPPCAVPAEQGEPRAEDPARVMLRRANEAEEALRPLEAMARSRPSRRSCATNSAGS